VKKRSKGVASLAYFISIGFSVTGLFPLVKDFYNTSWQSAFSFIHLGYLPEADVHLPIHPRKGMLLITTKITPNCPLPSAMDAI
jgi:hypothetical protein